MNLIKLGGLLGLAYFGSRALQQRGGARALAGAGLSRLLPRGTGDGMTGSAGTSSEAVNNGEQLNAARLSSLSAAPGGRSDDMMQSSSQGGSGPATTGVGDFSRGA